MNEVSLTRVWLGVCGKCVCGKCVARWVLSYSFVLLIARACAQGGCSSVTREATTGFETGSETTESSVIQLE